MANEKKGLQLEEGKVYLRDSRNGRVHQYEDALAQMSYMKRFVAGEKAEQEAEEARTEAGFKVSLTGLERASEWDRRAALTPEQRAAEDKKKGSAEAAVAKAVETTASGQPASGPAAPAQTATGDTDAKAAAKAASAPPSAPTTASGAIDTPPAPPAPPAKSDSKK